VDGMHVAWALRPKRWSRSEVALDPDAQVIDLSMTGALVRAKRHRDLTAGSDVALQLEGVRGHVVIRHVRDTDDPAIALYGVEFVNPGSRLRSLVHERVAGSTPADLEWRWHSGR